MVFVCTEQLFDLLLEVDIVCFLFSAIRQYIKEVFVLTGKEKKLLEALEPLAQENHVEIVTVEIVGSRRAPTIRVYVDTPDGVGFDELAHAQKWIGDAMDEIDPFPGAYTLEVSSPGIDRPLRTPQHFAAYTGETVQVTCKAPIKGRGKFTGKLLGLVPDEGAEIPAVFDGMQPGDAQDFDISQVDADLLEHPAAIALNVDGKRTDIEWNNIKRANVKGVIDFNDERNAAK